MKIYYHDPQHLTEILQGTLAKNTSLKIEGKTVVVQPNDPAADAKDTIHKTPDESQPVTDLTGLTKYQEELVEGAADRMGSHTYPPMPDARFGKTSSEFTEADLRWLKEMGLGSSDLSAIKGERPVGDYFAQNIPSPAFDDVSAEPVTTKETSLISPSEKPPGEPPLPEELKRDLDNLEFNCVLTTLMEQGVISEEFTKEVSRGMRQAIRLAHHEPPGPASGATPRR